jgi:hypothetical protein
MAADVGIPCIWAKAHNPLSGDNSCFKFLDYEATRGRRFGEPVDYEDLIKLRPAEIGDLATMAGRRIEDWQNELIAAFPFKH